MSPAKAIVSTSGSEPVVAVPDGAVLDVLDGPPGRDVVDETADAAVAGGDPSAAPEQPAARSAQALRAATGSGRRMGAECRSA
jgi:hypothetical protein